MTGHLHLHRDVVTQGGCLTVQASKRISAVAYTCDMRRKHLCGHYYLFVNMHMYRSSYICMHTNTRLFMKRLITRLPAAQSYDICHSSFFVFFQKSDPIKFDLHPVKTHIGRRGGGFPRVNGSLVNTLASVPILNTAGSIQAQ